MNKINPVRKELSNGVKVVLDTNTLIASLFGASARKIMKLWEKGEIRVCVSDKIKKEYRRIIYQHKISRQYANTFLSLLKLPNTILVNPKIKLSLIKDDPEDNKFMECALEGKVDYIISSDKHILNCRDEGTERSSSPLLNDIKIVSPTAFLRTIS